MNERLRWFLAIALAHGLLLAMLFKGIWSGSSTFVTVGDSIDQSFMWLTKIFSASRHGEVALWDFGVMSGISFAGELQTSPLYPVAWLAGLLLPPGTLQAFDTFLVLHFGIAALGMAAVAFGLGLSPAAAFVSSAIFAYGTSFSLRVSGQPNLFASLAWLPWVTFFFITAMRCGRGPHSATVACGAGAAIAMSLLAGHAHSTVLTLIAAGCLLPAVWGYEPETGRAMRPTAMAYRLVTVSVIAGATALLLALPQIIATKEYLELAYKWYGNGFTSYPHIVPVEKFINAAVGFRDLPTVLNGGQVRSEDGGTLFFTKTGLLLFLIAVVAIPYYRIRRFYGVLLSAAIIVFFALTFSFSFIKPFAYFYMNTPLINIIRSPPRALFVFGFAGALLAGVGIDVLLLLTRRILPTRHTWISIVPVVIAMAGLSVELRTYAPARVMLDVARQQALLRQTIENPIAEKIEALSRESGNVYRFYASRDLIAPNIGNFRPVLSAHGYRSSRTIAYHEFFDFDPKSLRMDALGVRWWVSDKPLDGLRLLAKTGNTFLYERASALPVLWRAEDGGKRSALPIVHVNWRENDVTFTFATPQSGRFVFGQTAYPGWRALLNERPVLLSIYEQLQSVASDVPATTVRFVYDPPWWRPSAAISAATAIAIFAIAVVGWSRRRAVPDRTSLASSDPRAR